MPRLTAKDFPQELLDYYDYYAHGKISKREFLNLAAKYAVGGISRWLLRVFDFAGKLVFYRITVQCVR